VHRQATFGDLVVVQPEGELDSFGASSFRQVIAEIAGAARVIFDLSAVTFIDSVGLGLLVGGIRRTRERGGQVAMACRRPSLLRVLSHSQIDTIVTIGPTLCDAVEALGSD
jgi:anti-sigma B factor antagonist